MIKSRLLFIALLLGLLVGSSSVRSQPSILDKQSMLDKFIFWDNKDWDWYKEKIPFFESPETSIDATYYYRWELMTKHLVYGSPWSGYSFTEFLDFPGWSGKYGGISCPAGHQLDEVRWLKDRRIIEDFSNYWLRTPGAQSRSYTNWYGSSLWDIYKVWQDKDYIKMVYPNMQAQYAGWIKERYDPEHKMFKWDGMHDGMESNINGRQTANWFAGGIGYRPTINSYLYGELNALSDAANLLGKNDSASMYKKEALSLKKLVQEQLWDPKREFFFHQWSDDRIAGKSEPGTFHKWAPDPEDSVIRKYSLTYQTGPYAGNPHGRELIGYVPWQFNLPDEGYSSAWKFLMDDKYFWSEYGPTTTEQNDPLFYDSPGCCVWSGQSWPYATAQTLVAMANLLNNYNQQVVNKNDYMKLLRTFTNTQRFNGRPYIAESASPFTGSWDGSNSFYHSEHYFHSQYVNLIITGLAGLRPRADDTLEVNPLIPDNWNFFALDGVEYHGKELSIVWDRKGNHYGKGKGLMIFVNGQKVDSSETLKKMLTRINPAPNYQKPEAMVNFAVNNENEYYPHLYSSSSNPKNPPSYAIDGNYWYKQMPPNRWTSEKSGTKEEWIILDFGIERPVSRLSLYFLDDGEGAVKAPLTYDVQSWNGKQWVTISGQQRKFESPEGHRPNDISFNEISTSKIRVMMRPRVESLVGLTEIEAWGKALLPLAEAHAKVPDLAYNKEKTGYPALSASFQSDQFKNMNDGNYGLPGRPGLRWSGAKSTNNSDWIQVDFGTQKQVSRIDLYLSGGEPKTKESFSVEYWNNAEWREVKKKLLTPKTPMMMALNKVIISPIRTSKIRINFSKKLMSTVNVTELNIWESEMIQ